VSGARLVRKPLVIFDFDGTLADSWAVAVEELRGAGRLFDLRQLSPEEVEALRGQPSRQVFDAFGVALWKIPRIATHMRRRFEERAAGIALFDGVAEMLRAVDEAGILIGVVSSNSEKTVATVLGPENMRRVAAVECGSSLFGKSRRFLRLLKELGATRADTIAVGDESRDLDAAADAGITGLAVEWGYARPALLQALAPGRTFATVTTLTARLLELAAGGPAA
jgi:phosphoglycolate phosphatase